MTVARLVPSAVQAWVALDAMTRRKIGVGVHYLSLPEHPYYQTTFGWRPEAYPHAMRIGRETVAVYAKTQQPVVAAVELDEEIDEVIEEIAGPAAA